MQVRADDKRFAKQAREAIQLQPGMTVTVEVKTGKNTVLRYLAKPIVKTMREAMVEK
jgi:adhesin transport system membrane fusion protein